MSNKQQFIKTSDFDYVLPRSLIAQTPVEPRDQSRLMIVDKVTGRIAHSHFHQLPNHVSEGDVLVFNDSRVIPARLYGRRIKTNGKIQLLLLSRRRKGEWRALVKPGSRMGLGAEFVIGDDRGNRIFGEVVQVEDSGTRIVNLDKEELIHALGVVPLPPYIKEAVPNPERYQTVYSRIEGSVAAPTAGLHFTENLLQRLKSKGAEIVFVTLHVGWDSFNPVKTEDPSRHEMHSEYWEISDKAAETIRSAKTEGRKVIAVGTTAARLLENAAQVQNSPLLVSGSGWADIFIRPGYSFRVLDNLITNFHLPKSTLMMLTSALAGTDLIIKAYEEAIRFKYRFYSFGDAMFIV